MSGSEWGSKIGHPDDGSVMHVAYRDESGRLQEIRFSRKDWSTRKISDDVTTMGQRQVPKWIEITTSGGAGPDKKVRIEIRDGSPEVVELSWISRPGQLDIRQKDLREINLAKLAVDTYAQSGGVPFPRGADGSPPTDAEITEWAKEVRRRRIESRKSGDRQRAKRKNRIISDELLRQVADVYRANIHKRGPTQAVAKQFGVGDRMASTYVTKAREKGLLPKTQRGKKKA